MAAILPAINPMGEGNMTASPMMHQQFRPGPAHKPSPPSKAKGQASDSPRGLLMVGKKKSQGRQEREMELRHFDLRAQQPDLTKIQTAEYRHSFRHNLCLVMLQEGFHKSFAELFALIRQQKEEREIAGPESVLWTQVMLEDEPDKLEVLQVFLTKAEAALRQDNYNEVYQSQYKLARYFQTTGDKWLADHFFENCLVTTSLVKGDEGRMAAEGHCNVGSALEESGDYYEAAENFELFHKLCKDKPDWALDDGEPMHYVACSNLANIYTTISSKLESEGDLKSCLSFLEKANEMAFGSGDRKLEAESCYRVGVAYEKNGNSPTALKYLNKYLELCSAMDDNDGYGKACEAIARSYDSQGKVEESIKYLEMFVEVAEKTKNDKATSRACSNLGAMFNSLGRYEQAVEYFNKSYNISRAMNDTETISSSRVLFGVAAAHKMLENFSGHVEFSNKPCMERILEWKDNRGDEFDKEIPTEQAPDEAPVLDETAKEETSDDKKEGDSEQTAEDNTEPTEGGEQSAEEQPSQTQDEGTES